MNNSPTGQSGQIKANPSNDMSIWNRVGHVEITIFNDTGYKTYDFDGLDFKFNVTQILGRRPEGNMSVSICGLSQDTANKIITICNIKQALIKRKTLKLYAGYADPEDKNYRGELLATMDIINATISSPPPDIWLQITAVYAGWLNDLKFAIDIMDIFVQGTAWSGPRPELGTPGSFAKARPILLGNCLEQICDGLNKLQTARGVKAKFNYDLTPVGEYPTINRLIPGRTRHFAFNGTLDEIPTEISKSYKVNAIWEERNDNNFYLTVYPDPRYVKDLTQQEKSAFTKGTTIKFLDVDHGLVGIPKLKDSIKLECRCFLDGKIKAGDYVSVRSQLIPAIYEAGENIRPDNQTIAQKWGSSSWTEDTDKGTVKAYQIMKVKYSGHLRGGEWFCDIEARRPTDLQSLETAADGIRPILLTEDYGKILKGWSLDEKTGALTRKEKEEDKK